MGAGVGKTGPTRNRREEINQLRGRPQSKREEWLDGERKRDGSGLQGKKRRGLGKGEQACRGKAGTEPAESFPGHPWASRNATSHSLKGMCTSVGQASHATVPFLECWTQRPLARGHEAVLIHSFIQQI